MFPACRRLPSLDSRLQWDFLDVAMEKPRRAMEACVVAVEELKPVKQADSECLCIWYEELRAIGERAKMEGVYAHLLTEAVADKILNSLTPKEDELVRTRMANIKEHRQSLKYTKKSTTWCIHY